MHGRRLGYTIRGWVLQVSIGREDCISDLDFRIPQLHRPFPMVLSKCAVQCYRLTPFACPPKSLHIHLAGPQISREAMIVVARCFRASRIS
jgi:hypothetical protein